MTEANQDEPEAVPPPLPKHPSAKNDVTASEPPPLPETEAAEPGAPAVDEVDIEHELIDSEEKEPNPPPLPESVPEAADEARAGASALQEKPPGRVRRVCSAIGSGVEWMIGIVSLIAGLAFLAVIPVLNFLSLGYMLAAGARVTETGRFRESLIGVRKAAVAGRIVFGTWLVLWPVRATAELWNAAVLIDPASEQTRNLRFVLVVLTFFIIWHITWATLRGGKIRHYLWPAPLRFIKWLRSPDKFAGARDAVWNYVASLNLSYYFHLGFRGFAGALLWLMLPTLILIAASNLPPEGGFLVSFIGALMLAPVVLFLPFLQAHFARTGELRQMFAVREVRQRFVHAPIAFWTALLVTFLFAVPLYLLKIELAPPEVAWLPSLVFVIFIFPARVLTGWAMYRSLKRETPTGCFVSWPARLAMVPAVFAYVLIVYSTQYLSWYGSLSLFEQHAFLVPAPMLGL